MFRVILMPLFTLLMGYGWTANLPSPEHAETFYPEELPGKYTGGFGEETCHSCHFDYPINPEEGSLSVEGLPGRYVAGRSYRIRITLKREQLSRAGFQLSSRFKNGRQAGTFEIKNDSLSFTETGSDIQYVQHSEVASDFTSGRSAVTWQFKWQAPKHTSDTVVINLAANAANGDESAFGDYVFVKEINVKGETKPY